MIAVPVSFFSVEVLWEEMCLRKIAMEEVDSKEFFEVEGQKEVEEALVVRDADLKCL